jgi:hypothetical protein
MDLLLEAIEALNYVLDGNCDEADSKAAEAIHAALKLLSDAQLALQESEES